MIFAALRRQPLWLGRGTLVLIARSPVRISFGGGGTDLAAYYERFGGMVVSASLNKYIYGIVTKNFDTTFQVISADYRTVLNVPTDGRPYTNNNLELRLSQAIYEQFDLRMPVNVFIASEVPPGTGLGSSSATSVTLCNIFSTLSGQAMSKRQLAETAYQIETGPMEAPIGKQDQYAAAFGGLRRYRFNPDGSVYVDPVICSEGVKNRLFENLMFFYVGGSRDAREILQEQSDSTERKLEHLQRLCDLVDRFHDVLIRGSDVRELGDLLHESWLSKRELAANVSNSRVDQLYEDARNAGAIGGKLLGAGQSGFLMLFCPTSKQGRVREQLRGLREVPMSFEPEGSKIIYVGR